MTESQLETSIDPSAALRRETGPASLGGDENIAALATYLQANRDFVGSQAMHELIQDRLLDLAEKNPDIQTIGGLAEQILEDAGLRSESDAHLMRSTV